MAKRNPCDSDEEEFNPVEDSIFDSESDLDDYED